MGHGVAMVRYGRCFKCVKSSPERRRRAMQRISDGVKGLRQQSGKLGWILLWAMGIPIPVLLVLFLLRGCT